MKLSKTLVKLRKQRINFLIYIGFFMAAGISFAQTAEKDILEIKIYHIETEEQEDMIDDFLEKAYLPALERAGISLTGVLKPIEGDTLFGKRVYVLTPFSSLEKFGEINETLREDKIYLEDGKAYLEAAHDNPPYERIETILLNSFDGMPRFRLSDLTDSEERIFELRSYEAATENFLANKVKMFNEGEIEIFERLDFNPIFFGEVLAGSQMPNLMYMTGFENKESRDAHWNSFGDDPAWKEMSVMEEYQNNVSQITITMLKPTPYSKL